MGKKRLVIGLAATVVLLAGLAVGVFYHPFSVRASGVVSISSYPRTVYSLPTPTQLETMDWSFQAQPFVSVPANSEAIQTMDWSFQAQPFVANYVSGVSISSSPGSKAFGTVKTSTTYWANGNTPPDPITDPYCFFTTTNDGSVAVNISIVATDFTGGGGWTLGVPDGTHARMTVYKSGDALAGGLVVTTSGQAFISALGVGSSKKWEVKLETPTSFADGVTKTSSITLTAVAS